MAETLAQRAALVAGAIPGSAGASDIGVVVLRKIMSAYNRAGEFVPALLPEAEFATHSLRL
jgi:hypothetical protein